MSNGAEGSSAAEDNLRDVLIILTIRGQPDERLRWFLTADRHIVIHGDSKQGKSWLRSRVLSSDDVMLVLCQPGQTQEQLLTEAALAEAGAR
jgi:hypothetical protein